MIVGTPVARLVRRAGGDDDGLILGAVFVRDGERTFRRGYVYEVVRDPLGELHVVEVGEAIPANPERGEPAVGARLGLTWAHEIGHLLGEAGKYLTLTRGEYDRHVAAQREDHTE